MLSLLNHPPASLLALILFRVTALLTIAWIVHLMLRRKNPRWQVLLWRATIIGIAGIMLCSAWHRGWGPKLWAIPTGSAFAASAALPQATAVQVESVVQSTVEQDTGEPSLTNSSDDFSGPRVATSAPLQATGGQIAPSFDQRVADIATGLVKLYFVVAGVYLFRLLLRVARLRAMLGRAEPADDRLTNLVTASAEKLALRRMPRILVSTATSVPLATGILRPVIVLPADLTERLSDQESAFVLAHECSHFKGADLSWALAARIVQILWWPHPLAWGLCSAHRYACDLRCDTIAAGKQSAAYSSMLAEMALKLNRRALPPTAMAFLQRSEVVSRVRRLESGISAQQPGRARRALAALGTLTVIGVVGTLGVNAAFPINPDEIDQVLVKVVDEDGNPVVGAEIFVHGLRARKEAASAHGNRMLTDWKTDESGTAKVTYPRYVYEEMETGALIVYATHPEFVRHNGQDHSVDQPILITMKPGRHVQITAIDAASGDRIKQRLFAMLPGDEQGKGFQLREDGTLVTHSLDPQSETLLLVALPDNSPALFSDLIDLSNHPAGDLKLENVTMSPGERLTGQLNDEVVRPVTGGFVGLSIAATFNPSPRFDNCIFWNDFASINEDGTFVFPSVPRDVHVQLSAIADGWVSVSAPPVEILQRFHYVRMPQHAQSMHDTMVISQLFPPKNNRQIVLEMEPTATCRIKVVTTDGAAVPNVNLGMSPNLAWSPGPGGIVGHYGKTSGNLLSRLEETQPLVKDNPDQFFLQSRRYFVITDEEGMATVEDLPGKSNISVSIQDETYEMPAKGGNPYLRSGNVSLTPGQTTEVTITVQPKGREVLGR